MAKCFSPDTARDKTDMDKQLTVFLVEDSPMLRARVIESLAEQCNSRVVGSADTEDDAVNGIRDSQPDAVVLDIQLRHGNGLNVLHRLNRLGLTKRPLVIVLTNYNNHEFRRHAIAAGTDYYFDKGSEFHRVGEVLNNLPGTQAHVQ